MLTTTFGALNIADRSNLCMKRFGLLHYFVFLMLIIYVFPGCDNRASPTGRTRPAPVFSVDLNVVKDLSQGKNIADITFGRNGVPFNNAIIKINDIVIPSTGNGHYFTDSPGFNLPTGTLTVSFASNDDSYLKSLTINIPDTIRITTLDPPVLNNGLSDVRLQWSAAARATQYILAVVARNYPANNSVPLSVLLGSENTIYTIPYTTFEDPNSLNTIDDTYYVYVVAFNLGFGAYAGMPFFPMPAGVPLRTISDPSGQLKYGTVAPLDSIIVQL
jgi:hypothetical protein